MSILRPLEIAVAWVMTTFYEGLTAIGMPEESGWTWVLAIMGLVLVIRILLIPLFVKQINATRGMALAQPEMQRIQKKYKDKKDPVSRQQMQAEMMEIYREYGNPFSSCLPILIQMPIFFALFRVLNGLDEIARGDSAPIGTMTQELARNVESSSIFGAQLSDTFMSSDGLSVKVVTLVLILLMSGSQFITQKQMMTQNMTKEAMESPFMQQQKIMLYVFPVIFAVTGVNFPIGVLIYWFASNMWSMAQQFYVLHNMPAPGSPAEERLNAKRAKKGLPPVQHGPKGKRRSTEEVREAQAKAEAERNVTDGKAKSQRNQPKKTKRSDRKN